VRERLHDGNVVVDLGQLSGYSIVRGFGCTGVDDPAGELNWVWMGAHRILLSGVGVAG
jgi:hypothetical protein